MLSINSSLLRIGSSAVRNITQWKNPTFSNPPIFSHHSQFFFSSNNNQNQNDQPIFFQLPPNFLQNQQKRQTPGSSQQNTQEDHAKLLDEYTTDITQQAKDGIIDPLVGRHNELDKVLQILSRRRKNNPVLIGEPGTGKTAIAEGLALRINANEVPESIKNKRLLSLDLPGLIAGSKYRGELEEKVKGILDAIKAHKDIIFFIDELHTIVGAGAVEGSLDLSNMLKPALARGDLHCIGATTLDEYRENIEKDAALARRFQSILVKEPTVEETISILRSIKDSYELYHGVQITDKACIYAAVNSQRYINDRFLPDKAIDLLDTACATLRLEQESKPYVIQNDEREILKRKIELTALEKETDTASTDRKSILVEEVDQLEKKVLKMTEKWKQEKVLLEQAKSLKSDLEKARKSFEEARDQGDLAKAAQILHDEIPRLEKQIKSTHHNKAFDNLASSLDSFTESASGIRTGKIDPESEDDLDVIPSLLRTAVTEEDIAKVISKATGIPLNKILLQERDKLLHMEQVLGEKIIGQPEAIEAISNVVRISRAGLNSPDRPIGSFFFLGPTGVGKTALAKALAEFLFDTEKNIIRIDMSEYSDKHSVSRLIGAPPGYVGYQEGGQLTEAVRRNPYSIVLFDEFEKGHPELQNILLQVLDEGHLTDNHGRNVSFKNTVLIMTSNIGAQELSKLAPGESAASIQDPVMRQVSQILKPEFLNRIDHVVMFRRLGIDQLTKITDVEIEKASEFLRQKDMQVVLTDSARQWLAKTSYDPVYGARPLKRAIQTHVMNPLATAILDGSVKSSQLTTIDLSSDGESLTFSSKAIPDS